MLVKPIKTKLIKSNDNINEIIKKSIKTIPENSILVISSKIISICENRFVDKITNTRKEKHELVKKEAEYYTDPHSSKYNMILTIKRNVIFVNAGLDESNANNKYILWPKNPQKSVNNIWKFIKKHYKVKNVGIAMSDSSSFMLNVGVIGRAIAYCGFNPLRSYIGTPDLDGRIMTMEQTNILQSIADAAVLEMGEGSERMPMAIVSNFAQPIKFINHPPTKAELNKLVIPLQDDAYYPILKNTKWKKGRNKK